MFEYIDVLDVCKDKLSENTQIAFMLLFFAVVFVILTYIVVYKLDFYRKFIRESKLEKEYSDWKINYKRID